MTQQAVSKLEQKMVVEEELLANNYPFNPIEKVVELYERLLTAEKEKVAMLQELLNTKK
ncbi:hypothetical protein [Geofilum rubicundum]|uniref:Uncharacterized protein n=1 Tax=Geofilum rubicundum JCM 15548 TaxID=1236989 RepID=A0A0E9M288_9BACT|nr:hypothetical protein [Geofilum rubicundum]GAO31713.1 hypothetical protein JCM15548_14104 [Geofilum rubicundum JCM 15548]